MSATLIPEADPEKLFHLEKTGETDELKALATKALEQSEITRDYDICYRQDSQKTEEQAGTHYNSHEISPYYEGSEPAIHVPIESNVEEFYANLNGEFRLVDDNGEDRTYKLVMACEEGILLKGEIGFGERETTNFRYMRGDEKNNRLQVYIDKNWCRFGNAPEIGEGNETMRQIELIESAYKQLNNFNPVEDQSWEITYSSHLQEDLEELPSYIESTMDKKAREFEQNLELGLDPENMLSAMSPPWKPLLEMKLGSNHRAMFIASSNLPQDNLPERLKGRRKLIGLTADSKKEFQEKFETGINGDSGSGKTNGLNYASNLL